MKKSLLSLLLLGGFSPLMANAEVNVQLHKDVEAIVIEGETLPLTVLSKRNFTLPNGQNQLVVRVSKLVTKGAEFEKYRSDPTVLMFDASNTEITIAPHQNIRHESEAKALKSSVKYDLDSPSGEISAQQAILPRGSGLMRDYERELAKFNHKNGMVFYLDQSVQVTATDIQATPSIQNKQAENIRPQSIQPTPKVNSEHAEILMKADFLRMTTDERKAFLNWAVQNIHS